MPLKTFVDPCKLGIAGYRFIWLTNDYFRVEPVLERYEAALLTVLGFGGFSLLLAFVHNAVRKHVFHDVNNLDTTFDAGGNVSLSLTAVTVASQMVWPGDFLHSATLAARVRKVSSLTFVDYSILSNGQVTFLKQFCKRSNVYSRAISHLDLVVSQIMLVTGYVQNIQKSIK